MVGKFTVCRPFFIAGELKAKGWTIDLADAELAGMLVAAGKVVPADSQTEVALRATASATWRAPRGEKLRTWTK